MTETLPSSPTLKAARERYEKWIKAQPFCVGYAGNCDGDLVGTIHEENCPMRAIEGSAGHSSMVSYFDVWLAAEAVQPAVAELVEALTMLHRVFLQRDLSDDDLAVSQQAWAALSKYSPKGAL